jgi:hypothetical protein
MAPKPARLAAEHAGRIEEINAELDVLRRLAARPGRAGQVAPLEAERGKLTAPTSGSVAAMLDVERLRPVIQDRVVELRAAFAGAPDAKARSVPGAAR